MGVAERELIDVLREATMFLALPENDFGYSRWENLEQASQELDGFIATIESGWLPERVALCVLFAPTGPIQEVSLSSGWGEAFLDLSMKFDAAESRVYEKSGICRGFWFRLKRLVIGTYLC